MRVLEQLAADTALALLAVGKPEQGLAQELEQVREPREADTLVPELEQVVDTAEEAQEQELAVEEPIVEALQRQDQRRDHPWRLPWRCDRRRP